MKLKMTLIILFIGIINAISINNSVAQDSIEKRELTTETTTPIKPLVQIIDHLIGTGKEAKVGNKVVVHYSGWLRDLQAPLQHGKAFDSSLQRGPFTFSLGAGLVIKGWDEGILGMKIGGKRTLIIPAAMAYGERGAGNGIIPPNADLVFDIELLQVKNE